jgi:hypothetical protein
MLYREQIAVCSQIHTKHINTLCGRKCRNSWCCSRYIQRLRSKDLTRISLLVSYLPSTRLKVLQYASDRSQDRGISGLCYTVNEMLALRRCYAGQIDSYTGNRNIPCSMTWIVTRNLLSAPTMKKEAACSSETFVITCETKRCHKPDDSDLNLHDTKTLNIMTIPINRCFIKICIVWILSSLLSPLCRIFTITYLQQAMFLVYTVLQLFCIYSLCYM